MTRKLFFLFFIINIVHLNAQKPVKPKSSEIFKSIQKLNFLGSVLYVAAHPDDENTRLISYFSNDVKARTGYLSITRGDGGQNLIGPELQELLGVIRTQELLAARSVDGGEQFFTRANDFGYSKHPDETLKLWNKDEVLKDVVTIIRKFRQMGYVPLGKMSDPVEIANFISFMFSNQQTSITGQALDINNGAFMI